MWAPLIVPAIMLDPKALGTFNFQLLAPVDFRAKASTHHATHPVLRAGSDSVAADFSPGAAAQPYSVANK